MSFSHEYNFPLYVGTGSIATTGRMSALLPGQIAIVKTDGAVMTGPLEKYEAVKVVQGSLHKKDKLNEYFGGLKKPDESINFLPTEVLEFSKSLPRKAVSEQWVIGWDRVGNDTLNFNCNTEYRFRIKVWGEDVYGTYLRPVVREIGFRTECCPETNCSQDCVVPAVSRRKYADQIAELINKDPELKWFVKARVVTSAYQVTAPTHKLWTLSVCDDGSPIALAKVQAQAGSAYPVERIARKGTTSIYQTVDTILGAGPADFVPAGEIALADCGVCPAGYTPVAEKFVHVVQRVVQPSTDLNSDSDKATFAEAVADSYNASATGKFLALNGAVASIEVTYTSKLTTPVNSDVLFFIRTEAAKCVAADGAAIAWEAGDEKYKVSRSLTVTIPKDCGGNNFTADMQAFYANNPLVKTNVVASTTGECDDIYTIVQWCDNLMDDGCYSPDQPKFSDLPSFNGFVWTPVPASSTFDENEKVGVIIETSYQSTQFGDCSFHPEDYYSVRPLTMEATAMVGYVGQNYTNPCEAITPSKKIRFASMPTQSGEWAIREYMKAMVYRINGEFYCDPRMREVLDSLALEVIDRRKPYVVHYFKVKQHRPAMNHTADFSPEIVEMRFVTPVDTDASALEGLLSQLAAQSGVAMKVR